jgi:hypothetical protein
MIKSENPPPSGGGDDARECAKQIADQIAPLMKVARSRRFDFLAYLLAMALREARRLSGDGRADGR